MSRLIHLAVNGHAGAERRLPDRSTVDVGNAVSLLRLVRRNIRRDGQWVTEEYRHFPRTLLSYMESYHQQDGRLHYYRRWARRLRQGQEED